MKQPNGVKIFEGTPKVVQEQINEWLASASKMPGKRVITGIYQSGGHPHIPVQIQISIFYYTDKH